MNVPAEIYKLEFLRLSGGRNPIIDWLDSLDVTVRSRLLRRLDRLKLGNFGDSKSVGGGVFELRCDFGAGYRLYFGKHGKYIIVILYGGTKKAQNRDIRKAQMLWGEYEKRIKG